VLLQTTPFVGMIRTQAKALGMPNLPGVVLAHPIAGVPIDTVYAKLDGAIDEIIAKLTSPVPASEVAPPPGKQWLELDIEDEWHDLQREFIRRGWGDGLPLIPPTEKRVAAMIAGSGLPAGHLVSVLTPRMGMATVEKIAANAVMAGCLPQHMPVLIAAVDALVDPRLSLKNMQVTTHPATPLLIVSGPLAQTLNVNGGTSAFGPGPWSNGVIGRAIRLILLNIGGAKPVEISKATMSHPGRYTFCIAENEAAMPAGWKGLRAERGFAPEVSTVTVMGCEGPHNINDHESITGKGVLTMIAGTMAQTGQNNSYYDGEVMVLLGPEHAATIAADGFTKDDVRRILFEQARIPMSRWSSENIERRLRRFLNGRHKDSPLDTLIGPVQNADDIVLMVVGGPGKHSMYIPTNGKSWSVTRPIIKADGNPWLPADFPASETK
jgi:hypothetical protein